MHLEAQEKSVLGQDFSALALLTTFCCRQLSCPLQDVWQHPWPQLSGFPIVAPAPHPTETARNVSGHCQMPRRQNYPQLKTIILAQGIKNEKS